MANAYVLSGSNLITFDTASPTVTNTIAITGVDGNETLVGIDVRPQNGILYALGVAGINDRATLYAISPRGGVATAVGTVGSIAFTDGSNPIDLPDPATTGYGFDFEPSTDRIRVTAGNGLNFRVNPNNGAGVDGDNTGLTTGGVTGTNPDGPVNGAAFGVDGSAYTNNQANNGGIRTLYTLDATTNSLLRTTSSTGPNIGTQALVAEVQLGGSTLNFTAVNGFDIPAGVNVAASGGPVLAGSGFAVLNVGGTTGLYSINLTNGAATFIGSVGNGTAPVQGLAIENDYGGVPAIALSDNGANLVRFNTASPFVATTQGVATGSLVTGETLVAITYRPSTGQLYAFGVNPADSGGGANTGTLYLVDPQNGALTIVGGPSRLELTTDGSTAVDLPPAAAGYGMDFDPVADSIRITTDTGLNFRINPNTGFAVDGNNGGASGSVAGTNPDGAINGSAVFGVSAAAYTNSFGGAIATTAYTLDSTSDKLFTQNPVNNGTQTNGLAITVAGTPIDFTAINAFEIPAGVRIGTSGTAVPNGFGYAVLTVAGTTSLYRIDLTTGAATNHGDVATGATQMSGLALGDFNARVWILNSPSVSLAENNAAAQTMSIGYTDDDPKSFSLNGGVDAAKFTINPGSGALSFVSAPDFETPTDGGTNNTYQVNVRVSDGVYVSEILFTVTITNVNDVAPVINSNGGGATAGVTLNENETAVATVQATDLDGGAPITYAIAGGADAGKFTIDPNTGALAFTSAPNFEAPTDAGANNTYEVQVSAFDGVNTSVLQTITVTVGNQNDNAPVFTSNGGGATANATISENTTAVTTVTTTDADGSTVAYSIVAGADSAKFTIGTNTGVLRFLSAPDFEAPADTDANNSYVVQVLAFDGVNSTTQAITVNVTGTNDVTPVITSNGGGATASVSIAENSTAVNTVVAADIDALR